MIGHTLGFCKRDGAKRPMMSTRPDAMFRPPVRSLREPKSCRRLSEIRLQTLPRGRFWHMSLAYAWRSSMPEQRHVKLFRNGRNQAVRIPVEFELPGDEAIMHRDGDRLVIEPLRKRGVLALLATMKPLDEEFPEIEDRPPAAEKVF
jgi:antitoxin VapB